MKKKKTTNIWLLVFLVCIMAFVVYLFNILLVLLIAPYNPDFRQGWAWVSRGYGTALIAIYSYAQVFPRFKSKLNWFSKYVWGFGVAMFLFSLIITGLGCSFPKWQNQAWISWTGAVCLATLLFYRKNYAKMESLFFALALMEVAGFIYEIPVYPRIFNPAIPPYNFTPIHRLYPLGVDNGLLFMPVLVYLCRRHGWQPTRKTWAALLILIAFSVVYYYEHPLRLIFSPASPNHNFPSTILFGWFARVPTILLMLTIPLDVATKWTGKN